VATFSLHAELALGLAGFAGVTAAFGGRDREYSGARLLRLSGIFQTAGCVLAGSLCVETAAAVNWANATA
jgi:hypothetical protein